MQIFNWREAIQRSNLEPSTRLVLCMLSFHMHENGEGCYPSTQQLAKITGLSERSVITHLQKAKEAGFIGVRKHGFAGKKWARHEYAPTMPENGGCHE